MATTLKINRQVETIDVRADDGSALYEWNVRTDDASMQRMISMVGNALDRAHSLTDKAEKADTDEARSEANADIARLQKRVISAIIGSDGYNDVLEYIGGGEPCDPMENIVNIGDVFGALCVWLYERCTAKQLREAGVYFERQRKSEPPNRAARRAKGKKKAK